MPIPSKCMLCSNEGELTFAKVDITSKHAARTLNTSKANQVFCGIFADGDKKTAIVAHASCIKNTKGIVWDEHTTWG